eukprot:185857_1
MARAFDDHTSVYQQEPVKFPMVWVTLVIHNDPYRRVQTDIQTTQPMDMLYNLMNTCRQISCTQRKQVNQRSHVMKSRKKRIKMQQIIRDDMDDAKRYIRIKMTMNVRDYPTNDGDHNTNDLLEGNMWVVTVFRSFGEY